MNVDVDIERILPGGLGLAHAEGLTLFVSLAAPGDRVRVTIDRTKGRIAFASIVEILVPSEARVTPPCPYFGRCGGCDFQQLTYQSQLNAKVEIIRDCLQRIARLSDPPHIDIEPSPEEWKYRSRTSWRFDSNQTKLGYFEGGSHRICDVEFCAVLVPELQQTLETLRSMMRADELAAISEFEAVAGDDHVSLAPPVGPFQTVAVSRRVGDESYSFNAESFFQINHLLLEQLLNEALLDAAGDLALDLYSGAGLFTLPLARRFKRVIAIESNRVAARFASNNIEQAGLTNTKIVRSRVSDWFEQAVDLADNVDLVLLDPPRTGAEPSTLSGILAIRPKAISYVSCDPATLARDLRSILNAGYRLDSLKAFDMFPQTHHVETVARLSQISE